jgi:heme o synthase
MEATAAAVSRRPAALTVLRDYLTLTKPKVQSLLLFTTVTTMFIAGTPSAKIVLLTCLGGYLSAGGASAINHYYDRDIDARMKRTSTRPVPAGRIAPAAALSFGIVLGALSILVLWIGVNSLAAGLSFAGFLCYVFVYTVWLKRSTPQNIVIGGAAGAVPPLVGWAATTGGLSWTAIYLFAIVFYWTPPHFWALALRFKGDYAAAGVPMLPVVRGEAETARQIVLYSVLLVAVSLLLFPAAGMGIIYLASAIGLGLAFVWYAVRLVRDGENGRAAIRLFRFSISYLTLLFMAVAADALFRLPLG